MLAFCAVLVLATIIKYLNGNASKIDLAFQDSLKAMKQVKLKKSEVSMFAGAASVSLPM